MTDRLIIQNAQRIVIKIGSTLLTEGSQGMIREKWLGTLAEDIVSLRRSGSEVVLVSSGAIAVGRGRLGLRRQILKLEENLFGKLVGYIH